MEQTTTPIKYFLYARKSSDAEDRQVASVGSQIDEMRKIAKEKKIKITKIFREEKSAKAPGRPIFNLMMQELAEGKADGVISWRLNRLARNPVDGGEIIWRLQQNEIKHIVCSDREYKPEDNVLLMYVELGMANQFINDLKKDTKRGLNNKIKMGWMPCQAPLGYKNDKINPQGKKKIFVDDERFDLVRSLWDLLLTGIYSVPQIWEKAKEMGLTNPRTGRIIHLSKLYKLFNNIFYTGKYEYAGEIYDGEHEKMITEEEFERGQAILGNTSRPRKKTHIFTYTGLIKCGECGGMITAEEHSKTQQNGNYHHYIYYHCTKRKHPECSQPAIKQKKLEKQLKKLIKESIISEKFYKWAVKYLRQMHKQENKAQMQILNNFQKLKKMNVHKLNNLIKLRLEDLIDDSTFKKQRKILEAEGQEINKKIEHFDERNKNWLELAENALNFAFYAYRRFEFGTIEDKKIILKSLGLNLYLKDKKVDLYPIKIFRILRKSKKSNKWVARGN